MKTTPLALAAAFVLAAVCTTSQPALADDQPVELGRIEWRRGFEEALAEAKASRRPMMVLFDEVPGCHTCQRFGTGPLSHPIVVDAAGEFVAVAVYNNIDGPDKQALTRFKEPAWNNPVVRFLDSRGRDLTKRHADDYSTAGLLARMVEALEKAHKPVPEYLRLVAAEYNPRARETATFAMHCYWEGEAKFGLLDGVLATRIGMLDGSEVVELDFDPTALPYRRLVAQAKAFDCTNRVFARTDEQARIAKRITPGRVVRSDARVDASTTQQYNLANAPHYYYLPLTALQATKVNTAIAAAGTQYAQQAGKPDDYLSPTQLALTKRIAASLRQNPDALSDLYPNRSPEGITQYAIDIENRLTEN